MEPEVSIIIPTYNRADFLKEALESLANQTFKNFEVLVVDDGSTDSTRDIIKSYAPKINLSSIYLEENRGVSHARNLGIQKGVAPWIAFLDSDDLWLPQKLEMQLQYLKDHPELEICQTEEIWIRRGIRVNPMKKHQKSGGDIFKRCLELCMVSPSATVISRGLFEKVGPFNEALPVCEDYDLWLKISSQYPIGLLSKPLIIKRGGHRDQLSKKYAAMDRFRIQAIQQLLQTGNLTASQRNLAEEELHRKVAIYLNGAQKRGQLPEALSLIRSQQPAVSSQI